MSIHPREHKDLMLAPVAVAIDQNLQRIRDKSAHDTGVELELALDKPAVNASPDQRATLVLRQAVRNVDLRGWHATLTPDSSCVRLEGGSVSLDLGLGTALTSYITGSAA